jgi:hypothetical protein
MANLLEEAAAFIADQRAEHLSVPILYRQGAVEVLLRAGVGSSPHTLDDGSGMLVEVRSRDYLVAAADLAPVQPRPGDRIVEGGMQYEVMAPGSGARHAALDPAGLSWRIHTKRVSAEGRADGQ